MKCFDLFSHALRDVRTAHAQLDVQAASATLLLIAFFAVVGAALATEIRRAIIEEMSRSRFFFGTFTIEGHRGHLTAIEPSVRALVDDQSSNFAGVSTIYAGVLSNLSGLEPVGADRAPYSPNSVVIRPDDPLVTPGFGLSLGSPKAFAPTERIGSCWRFAFVMTRRALVKHHGYSTAEADSLLRAPGDEMPSISFMSTEILDARSRTEGVVLAPFLVTPERVIVQENHAFPDYLLYRDAGLALAQLEKKKWYPTIFRQFRKGLRDDCDAASLLTEFDIQPWNGGELRKISNFRVAAGLDGTVATETLVVSPDADGYAELPDRESINMRELKVERFLVWVDDYLSLAAFEASEGGTRVFRPQCASKAPCRSDFEERWTSQGFTPATRRHQVVPPHLQPSSITLRVRRCDLRILLYVPHRIIRLLVRQPATCRHWPTPQPRGYRANSVRALRN